MGKHATDLCSLKGKFRDLIEWGPSRAELNPQSSLQVAELIEFSAQFVEKEHSQSDLCSKTLSAHRLGMWFKKRCDDKEEATHEALFQKINKCNDAIHGLRDLVFSLCSDVYVCIEKTRNVQDIENFADLHSIWHCRDMEDIQAAAAREQREARVNARARQLSLANEEAERAAVEARRALRSPVDLTRGNDPGGSNNSESSDSE